MLLWDVCLLNKQKTQWNSLTNYQCSGEQWERTITFIAAQQNPSRKTLSGYRTMIFILTESEIYFFENCIVFALKIRIFIIMLLLKT